MLKSVPAPSKWERYREALDEEQVPSLLLSSLDTPVEQFAPDATWVVALDPDDLSLERLGHVLGLGAPARASSSHTRFVALCSHGTSPAKLCRLFSAGAYLSEQDIAPQALLRLCRLAARDSRAPLMRFSERAGFSEAEQRAFFAECAGLSKCEAADELRCSPRTLETYWSRIFAKLRIRSTDGVVAAALRFAMLDSGAAA